MPGILSLSILDSGLKAKIAKIQAAMEGRVLYERVGAAIQTQVRLGFKAGRDPWGFKWASPKMRAGQPLIDTGRLRNSIQARADDSGVTVGTNLVYARVHQFGATIVAKNAPFLAIPKPGGGIFRKKQVQIPARPYLPINPATGATDLPESWRAAVVARLKAHFVESMKGAA